MSTFLSIRKASPQDLIKAALELKEFAVSQGKLNTPEKVFPQLNAEAACFAYAALSLFGGKADMTKDEIATASEVANSYRNGFKTLLAELIEFDVNLRSEMKQDSWNMPFVGKVIYTDAIVAYKGVQYQLAVTRKLIKGNLVTSICFVQYKGATQETNSTRVITPEATIEQAIPAGSFEAIETPAL